MSEDAQNATAEQPAKTAEENFKATIERCLIDMSTGLFRTLTVIKHAQNAGLVVQVTMTFDEAGRILVNEPMVFDPKKLPEAAPVEKNEEAAP